VRESKEGGALENMWSVILIKSDAEPWWFFDDWKKDIVNEWKYTDKNEAIKKYLDESVRLSKIFPRMKTKTYNSIAFWNENEVVFCEGCDDDLQVFHGIILFENEEPMEINDRQEKLKEEIHTLISNKN
jgi:hypothetical protein